MCICKEIRLVPSKNFFSIYFKPEVSENEEGISLFYTFKPLPFTKNYAKNYTLVKQKPFRQPREINLETFDAENCVLCKEEIISKDQIEDLAMMFLNFNKETHLNRVLTFLKKSGFIVKEVPA